MPILDRINRRQSRQHSYENSRPDVPNSPSPTQSTNYISTTLMHSDKPSYRYLAGKREILRNQQSPTRSQQGVTKQRSISPVGDVAMKEDWVGEYEQQWGNVFQNGNKEDEEFLVNSSDHSFCFNQQDEDFINYGSMSPQKHDKNHPQQKGLMSQKQSQLPRGPRRNDKYNHAQKENSDSNIPRPVMKQSTSSDSTSRGAHSSSSSSRSQSGNSITNSIQRWQLRTQNVLFSGVSGRGMSSSVRSTDSPIPSMSMDTNSITSEIQQAEVLEQIQQDSDASSAGSSKFIPHNRPSSPAASASSVSIHDFITGDENARQRAGSRSPSEVSFEFQHVGCCEEESSVEQVNSHGYTHQLFQQQQKQRKFVDQHRYSLWQRTMALLFCILICLAAGFTPVFWVAGNMGNQSLNTQQQNKVVPQSAIFLHGFSTEMRWVKHAVGHVMEAMDQYYPIVETIETTSQQSISATNNVDDQGIMNSKSGVQAHEMHVEQQLQLAQKIGQIQQVVSSSSSPSQQQHIPPSLTSQFTTGNMYQQQNSIDEVLPAQQQNEEAAQTEESGRLQSSSSLEDQSSIPDDSNTTPQTKNHPQTIEEKTPQNNQQHQPTHHKSWSSPFASVKSTPSSSLQTPSYKSHVKNAIRNFKERITNSVLGPWFLSFVLAIIIVVGAGSFFSDLGDWIIENIQQAFKKSDGKNSGGLSNNRKNRNGYLNHRRNQSDNYDNYSFQYQKSGRKSSSGDYTNLNYNYDQNHYRQSFDDGDDILMQQHYQKQHQAKKQQEKLMLQQKQQQQENIQVNKINKNSNNNYNIQVTSTFQSCRQNSLISRYFSSDENDVPEEIMDTASTPRRKSKRILQNHRP